MVYVLHAIVLRTDDRVIMASETGALPIDPKLVKENGRLQPGKMFVVDLEAGQNYL